MLKKIKHANGKREIFLFGKKVFEYVNHARFADFVANSQQCAVDYSLHSKLNSLISAQIIALQGNKDELFMLGQGTGISSYTPLIARNNDNIAHYLELLHPFVSPSLKLIRVGGAGDGGYAMLDFAAFEANFVGQKPSKAPVAPPPPFNAV